MKNISKKEDNIESQKNFLPLLVRKASLVMNKKKLLKEVSFNVQKNSILSIVGPNGAGKTSLLKVLHGIYELNSGSISWGAYSINEIKKMQAMIFQNPLLLKRSVKENIEYVLKIRNYAKSEILNKTNEVLDLCNITELQNQQAHRLSGGEKQKLSIARAWVLNPNILFLDEPTLNLDPPSVYEIEDLIINMHEKDTFVMFASHDLRQVRKLSQEVVFLYDGKLIEKTESKQFFESSASDLTKSFIQTR
ncbi:MAG: ATP-binding cassette domain-containing protein [Pseudomonadota bacterium]